MDILENQPIMNESLSRQLITSVFLRYIIFAIFLTVLQLGIEYFSTKKHVQEELKIFSETFSPSLARSLWDADLEYTNTAFLGMVALHEIIGLKLESEKGELVASSGVTDISDDKNKNGGVFSHRFDIFYDHGGRLVKVGSGTVYSSNSVVLALLYESLVYIIISSILKTTALWVLFLSIAKRQIHIPLSKLIQQINLNEGNPKTLQPIDLELKQHNELSIVQNSFNSLQDNYIRFQNEISSHAERLEKTVLERTLQLKHAKERAEKASETKSNFLAKTSHELRTPLNAIINLSHNLDDANFLPIHKEQLTIIQSASNNLLALVNDILDISKIEAGDLTLQKTHFDLDRLVVDTVNTLTILAQQKGLRLSYELPSNRTNIVEADFVRLQQILINLINNAIKFTDKGSVEVKLCILKNLDQETLFRFDIIDTGIGIAAKDQAIIFNAFTRGAVNNGSNVEGSGLGLTICSQLVEIMNGTLKLKSDIGKGSVFILTLPLKKGRLSPLKVSEKTPLERQSLRTLNIILAEDNKINRQVSKVFFDKESIPLKTTPNGYELLEALKSQHFDLIIMDLDMPIIDGIKATKLIRSGEVGEQYKNITIIVVSAFATTKHEAQSLDAGADAFLTKPIHFTALFNLISQLCNVKNPEIPVKLTQDHTLTSIQKQFISQYSEEMNNAIIEFESHLKKEEYDKILSLTHKLKSSSSILGQEKIVGCLVDIEFDAQDEDKELLQESLVLLSKAVSCISSDLI